MVKECVRKIFVSILLCRKVVEINDWAFVVAVVNIGERS